MSYAGPTGAKGYRDEVERVSDILSRMDKEKMMGFGCDQLKEDIYTVLGNYLYLLKYGLGVTKEQAMEALFTTGLNDLVTRIVWNQRKENHMDDSLFVRPILKAEPRIRSFLMAVQKAAEETGITVTEMRDAFGLLEGMAERRAYLTKVAALGISLPEDKK